MGIMRRVVVFDAADIAAESAFWAGMLDGRVLGDDDFHNVIDADDRWAMGVQRAPDHRPPDWPHGNAQQVHLDLHVDDAPAMHAKALALGARLLQAGDLSAPEGHQVYACCRPATPSASGGATPTTTPSGPSCAARPDQRRPSAPVVASDVPASSA